MIPYILAVFLVCFLFDLHPADMLLWVGRSVAAIADAPARLPRHLGLGPRGGCAEVPALPRRAPLVATLPPALGADTLGPGTADYLVLPRSQIRNMPGWWRSEFGRRVAQIDAAYAHLERPESYEVIPVAVRTVEQIDSVDLFWLDVDRIWDEAAGVYRYLLDGEPIDNSHVLLWPVDDPAAGKPVRPVLDEISL